MSLGKWLLAPSLVAVVSAAAPPPASADWTLTPLIGWNLGGSADINAGSARENSSPTFRRTIDYGASLTTMGKGAVGFEIDFGYSPNFFKDHSSRGGLRLRSDGSVTTLTGNVIIGARGGSVRPYAVSGVGLIRTNIQGVDHVFSSVNKNDLGLDVGAGVMGVFAQNVGLRGDVRYFRGFRGTGASFTGLALNNFQFWRASLGLSLKF
jgi:opacity protein-like surface antigen